MLLICLLLAAAAVLTACGEKPEPAQPPVQEVSPVADEQPAQEPEPAPEVQTPAEAEEPAEPEAEEPALTEDAETPSVLETALSFVDQDAQLLLDALGELHHQYPLHPFERPRAGRRRDPALRGGKRRDRLYLS